MNAASDDEPFEHTRSATVAISPPVNGQSAQRGAGPHCEPEGGEDSLWRAMNSVRPGLSLAHEAEIRHSV